MKQYRKKPIVIEAIQWYGENFDTIYMWMDCDNNLGQLGQNEDKLQIRTLEGLMEADFHDYIIKGIQGEFYLCKPDIFEATYEEVI